ncbi:MAG: PAS domain-containing protein, partial [Bdellovibrionales bacterium]|nr:PAS domain-containing protein [Bdellovibrionales bacterium]
RSGNQVFVRLSKYSLPDLLGQPHNIIRHPDMPRAVFKLLWDYLLSGKPIAAYVKNLAADGSYYWVFALVTFLQDGFLSIRLKPSSRLFPVVKELYKTLREIELKSGDRGEDGKQAMSDAHNQLIAALNSLGLADYDEFMYLALQEEMRSRDQEMNRLGLEVAECKQSYLGEDASDLEKMELALYQAYRKLNGIYQQIDDFVELNASLMKQSSFIEDISDKFRYVAINTAIESAKLGNLGESLGVIANHLGESSQAVEIVSGEFFSHLGHATAGLKKNIFNLAAARLQMEVSLDFCREALAESSNGQITEMEERVNLVSEASRQSPAEMLKDLESALNATLSEIGPSLGMLGRNLGELDYQSEELRKTILTLRFAQLGGIIESTRIDVGSTFTSLFEEIESHIEGARTEFRGLSRTVQQIASSVQSVPVEIADVLELLEG